MYPRCPECKGAVERETNLHMPGQKPAQLPHVHNPNRLGCEMGHTFAYPCPVVGCEWISPALATTPVSI